MLSRFMTSALEKLEKLSVKETDEEDPEVLLPTQCFPSPPPEGKGTRSLCARCLTLISRVVSHYGDGKRYEVLDIPHSSSLSALQCLNASLTNLGMPSNVPSDIHSSAKPLGCVICTKTLILFEAARAHISFEPSLRKTPQKDWSLIWRVEANDNVLPNDPVSVVMSVLHKNGAGWGSGSFKIYPDLGHKDEANPQEKNIFGEYPVIVSLDLEKGAEEPSANGKVTEPTFSSTLSRECQALVSSWAMECATTHIKCRRIFGTNGLVRPGNTWFPDRLLRITRTPSPDPSKSGDTLTARIVAKHNPSDFALDKVAAGITYISLSHCWGPSPDPSAPLGGRAGTVLTQSNLSEWQKDLPLDDLPVTFQDAVQVCHSLGFEYIWIDSLCIIQDSLEDWQTQSAVMGDVYKYAWLNIAALSSKSDYEGFINDSRDARVEFGFRIPFASILGRAEDEKNSNGQECILLRGKARFLWNFAPNIPASNASNAPLFKRAWVYQERSLARRTLAFTKNSLYWACDEYSRGERPDWAIGGLEPEGLRWTQNYVLETRLASRSDAEASDSGRKRLPPEKRLELLQAIDRRWSLAVMTYTLCNLTKHTDKLIAISSIARELSNTKILGKRYLAGFWDMNLPFQMAWITVHGRTTPAKKRVGTEGYSAPSWSWASIDAPVQPRSMIAFSNKLVAMADIISADVVLETDFVFGSVKAGFMRVRGNLHTIQANKPKLFNWEDPKESLSLIDEATGAKLWFCPDTIEGYDLVHSGRNLDKMKWMPLTLRFASSVVECISLCLVEVEEEERMRMIGVDGLVEAGQEIYRRLGTCDFACSPNLLAQNLLLLGLGEYPVLTGKRGADEELANGFKRREDGFSEFVLI